MGPAVSDMLRAAAAVAVYAEAENTQVLHLLVGSFIYTEQSREFLKRKGVPDEYFELWTQRVREPLLLLEDCTPDMTPALRNLLTRYLTEDRAKGKLTERNLMLHLLRDPDRRIDHYMRTLKVDRQEMLAHFSRLQEETADSEADSGRPRAFSDYLENLNDKAKGGEIHHIQGREEDVQWLVDTLCQRRKKNAILIGHPGVGKTALIEELALLITEGKVPDQLKGNVVQSLDVGGMVAGTKLRGQFEERMNNLVRYLRKTKNIILFIDEIHTIMSAGSARGSNLNASNMLKPALSRGEVTCVGATTPDDVGPLESDPAFKRRFQFRWLGALNDAETLEVLRAEARRLELHYGLTYTIGGIKRILEAANEFYPHQFNPDKALTLADAVGSYTKNRIGLSVVNTKAVNATLRAKNFRESSVVAEEVGQWLQEVMEDRRAASDILLAISSHLLHLRLPSVLILVSEQEWLVREIVDKISKELYDQDPITLNGEELCGSDATTLLRGSSSVYWKEPTLLDGLRYAPHQVVHLKSFDKSALEFQRTLSRALVSGELLEANGRKLPLRHSLFIVSSVAKRTCGFGSNLNRPNLPAEMVQKATLASLENPRPAWVEQYLLSKMQAMADRVKGTIKVAFSAEIPAVVRQKMDADGEANALRRVETAILKASQQQIKRLVISAELLKEG